MSLGFLALRGHVVRPSVYLAVSVCRATGPAVGVTYIVRLSEIDTRRVLCTVVGLYNRGWACRVRGLRPGCAARGPDRGPPLTRVRSRSASAFRPPDRRLVRGFPVAVLLLDFSLPAQPGLIIFAASRSGPAFIRNPDDAERRPVARRPEAPSATPAVPGRCVRPTTGLQSRVSHE